MQKRNCAQSAFVLACLASGAAALCQTAVPPRAAPAPAAPAQPPAVQPSGPPILAEEASRVHLRDLSVVEDARQTQTSWHDAAKQAEDQLTNPELQKKVDERLNLISTKVADALIKQPGESAVVTIAVYSAPDSDDQQSVAVAYEGLGESLNPSFFPRLLADMPFPSEQQKVQDEHLVLDTQGTSYMLYHLSGGDLKAADVSQEKMKSSFGIALTKARQPLPAVASGQQPTQAPVAPVAPPPAPAQQSQQSAQADAQNAGDQTPGYLNTGVWGWGNNPLWQPYWVIPQNNGRQDHDRGRKTQAGNGAVDNGGHGAATAQPAAPAGGAPAAPAAPAPQPSAPPAPAHGNTGGANTGGGAPAGGNTGGAAGHR